MSFSYRKSKSLLGGGVRLNASKSGLGMSVGGKGFRMGVNGKGKSYTSVSIPGTGLRSTQYHGQKKSNMHNNKPQGSNKTTNMTCIVLFIIFLAIGFPPIGVPLIIGIVIWSVVKYSSPQNKAKRLLQKAKESFNKRDYEQTKIFLNQAYILDPNNKDVIYLLGATFHNTEDFDEAYTWLEKYLFFDKDNLQVIILAGNCLYQIEKYDHVVRLLQGLNENDKNDLRVIQLIGASFAKLGNYDLAIEVFKRAPLNKRKLDSSLLELHYNLALIYEEAGDYKNATKHYKKVYATDISYRDVADKLNNLDASQNYFNKSSDNKNTIDHITAYIKYFNLNDWWEKTFNKEEKDIIIGTYMPLGMGVESTESITSTSQTSLNFLHTLAGWFNDKEHRFIAKRILEKAESLAATNKDVLDEHFLYYQIIKTYYPEREDPKSFEKAIDACEKQIGIADKAKEAFLKEYPDQKLPSHTGYEQLAIIRAKQDKYKEAIDLSEQAMNQGWAGDWEKRIERYRKKI